MKKLYILFFFIFSFIANAQIINIPDATLKALLLQANPSINFASTEVPNPNGSVDSYTTIDLNGDGEIQVSEAQMIKWLNVGNELVLDYTGIEAFTNLLHLSIRESAINSIDLSNNANLLTFVSFSSVLDNLDLSSLVNLKRIHLTNSPISTINVSNNTLLEQIFISDSPLSNIDVSQNLFLNTLSLINCQFTTLNLSQNILLQGLGINGNSFTNIDLSQNVQLKELFINDNQFSNLDLSQNLQLEIFESSGNPLNSLDLSQHLNLFELGLSNTNLTTIDLTNNFMLESLYCGDNLLLETIFLKNGYSDPWYFLDFPENPSLKYLCCDDDDIGSIQSLIASYNYSSCHVNSYCSFTPNGTFYEISGNTNFDLNNNGCDISDINYLNLNLSITDGINSGSLISNQTGNYYIPVDAGNHIITPNLENPTYFNISPTNLTVDFPSQASPFTQDFCVTANGVKSDVEVMAMLTVPARPGFDAIYKIVYRNKGNQIENGSVALTFDDAILDYVTSNPVYNSSATNSFTWNYTNLQPFETREIEIVFNVNSPMESPAVNNGDILNYTALITTTNTDETPNDNTFALNQTVVGSYDPNDKTCLEGETIEPSMVGEYVHYVIRFENTGTFPAQNIVVKDMIDLAKFDIATLVPLKGSHDFYTRINGNKVEFIFENINLDFNDATNDGYVAFKIKTKSTLVVGNTFSNDANIYFDYNFPITTNTYTTTIAALSTQNFEFGSQFTLYPNPAKEVLNIQSKNSLAIQSIEIYNLLGQVVLAVPNNTNAIDVSNLKTGTYFVKVNTEKGSSNTKFVKE